MKACLASVFLVVVLMTNAVFIAGNDEYDQAYYKRATCQDKIRVSTCQRYQRKGFCAKRSVYYSYMAKNCPATCGIKCTSVGNSVQKVSVKVNECLRAHNSKRALHGALPLTWDRALARQAQAYAIKLAQANGGLKHDPNRGFTGENLQWFSLRLRIKDCKAAVHEWYIEEQDYPFTTPPQRVSWLYAHFTQLVWKSTRKVGVGMAKNRFRVYIVARYSPPGNLYRKFAQNVGNKTRG